MIELIIWHIVGAGIIFFIVIIQREKKIVKLKKMTESDKINLSE